MSLRRKLLGFLQSQKKGVEYTELEYLESTGTQWIDTGLIANQLIDKTLYIKMKNTGNSGNYAYNGAYDVTGTGLTVQFGLYATSDTQCRTTQNYFDPSYSQTTGLDKSLFYELQMDKTTYWLNGEVVGTHAQTDEEKIKTCVNPFLIFGRSQKNAPNSITPMAISEFWIKNADGSYMVDLIPVLDKDFTPCMYDKVTGKFFYNQGDGEFKWKLPNQLEYLESTDDQYIDTLLPVTDKTGAFIDAEWVYENTAFSTLSGCYQNFMVMAIVPKNRRICYSYDSNSTGVTTYPLKDGTSIPSSEISSLDSSKFITENGRFQVGLNYLGSRKWTYKTSSENYETELGETVVQNVQTITLFGRRYNATPQESNSYFWKGKIYSAIFTEGDKIVRYFVPAFDENLNPCMYDLVSKEYFRNKGTGSFKGYFEDGSRLVSYLSATGTQWIETGITPLIGDEIELKNVLCKKKGSGMQTIFSAGTGNYQTILLVADGGYPTRGGFYKYFATGGAQNVNEPYFLNDLTTIRVDGEGSIYYNDEFIVQSPPVQETDGSMRLFYRANDSSPMTGNIGAVSIKRDGNFVINLVSVIKSDNTVCMLDLVSKHYFVNQGSGTFNYG